MKNYVLLLILISVLSGCGNEGDQAKKIDLQNPKEKILALESNGTIPKLDRGDDIVGSDTNKNGVRDDIEAYIEKNYPAAAQRAAVVQFAKSLQETMSLDTSNAASVKAIDLKVSKGMKCIYLNFEKNGNSKHPAQVTDEIEAMTANTKPRLLQYLRFNKALDGSVLTSPQGDACE